MDKYKWIIRIGGLIIILFLVFVIYSKSQWSLVESEPPKNIVPSGNNTESSTGGHVRYVILAEYETNCTDDLDNDGDGLNNCMDPDCSEEIVCQDETN